MNYTLSNLPPKILARAGGILYLLIILMGIFNEVVIKGRLIVPGNPAETAVNLRFMETLWRMGIVLELLIVFLTVFISFIIYILTRPVAHELALLALLFGILATGVQASYVLQLLEVLFPLSLPGNLHAFNTEQVQTLISLSIETHSSGFAIVLLLFGPFFLITGFLIYHSSFLPGITGVLYIITGFSYMLSSIVLLVVPAIGERFYFLIAGPALIGELTLALWLILKGIDIKEWDKYKNR